MKKVNRRVMIRPRIEDGECSFCFSLLHFTIKISNRKYHLIANNFRGTDASDNE